MQIITDELNYFIKRNNSSILKYSECLKKYSSNFTKEISLKTDSSIFLDTNVLLRYYSISFTAREKLYEFIKNNKERMILTNQVQYEFIKNREDVIQRFFEQVTNKIPKDFNSDVVNKMKSFLETHKIVLKDYPFVETGIEKHKDELEKLLNKLNETSEQKRKDHIDLIVKDKFLDLLNSCTLLDKLENNEIEILKKNFDFLKKGISNENIDSILNKPDSVFPGLGDIKNKPDDPYGDYIIFHEMMKYIFTNKTDAIFLTFDNTKGDWMSKSKSPYLHYIQNMYSNTNQIIYILDAERTLGELLNVNIQSLVETETDNIIEEISIKSLINLTKTNQLFNGAKTGLFSNDFIKELNLAGYNSISQIEADLNKGEIALQEYLNDKSTEFNTLGRMRITLRIVNPNYIYNVGKNEEIIKIQQPERYAKYRIYVSE